MHCLILTRLLSLLVAVTQMPSATTATVLVTSPGTADRVVARGLALVSAVVDGTRGPTRPEATGDGTIATTVVALPSADVVVLPAATATIDTTVAMSAEAASTNVATTIDATIATSGVTKDAKIAVAPTLPALARLLNAAEAPSRKTDVAQRLVTPVSVLEMHLLDEDLNQPA